ncbi:MAG: cytochrome-c peroxidase [Calditerrivibrio sp.]|nr:cytochrome-c peroxidase [Calditerrivibrio sp.]
MNKKVLTTVIFLSIGSLAFASEALLKEAKKHFVPIPSKPPVLKDNPYSKEKYELGKLLYFDPRMSKSGLISCNSCHNVGLGGGDFQETSTGHGWQKGPRNAPTVLNSVFNIAQFWDGRAKDLAEQAKGPVQAAVEMNNTPERVIATIKSMPEYVELFKKAFPNQKDPVTFDNFAKAIELFEATLITPDSRFDKYLKGDIKALTKVEKEGLKLFMEKGCVDCHKGVNMGGHDYYPFGVVEKPKETIMAGDKGRFMVTNTSKDEYVFKSPSLRNIELTAPYFHSGKVWSLKEAIQIMGSAQLGISLNSNEVDKIYAFLKTTTGKQPQISHPIFPVARENTPLPDLK